MFRLVVSALVVLSCSSVALAAPSVPTRGQVRGDVVHMNQQFHVNGFNIRIESIRWIASTSPLAARIASLPQMEAPTAPNGFLEFKVLKKNTQSGTAPGAGLLKIMAFYRDGTQADDGVAYPFSTSFHYVGSSSTNIYPGQGMTVYYFIENVPQPSKQNPLTKLVISDPSMYNDPGYPKVYRLLNPVLTP